MRGDWAPEEQHTCIQPPSVWTCALRSSTAPHSSALAEVEGWLQLGESEVCVHVSECACECVCVYITVGGHVYVCRCGWGKSCICCVHVSGQRRPIVRLNGRATEKRH